MSKQIKKPEIRIAKNGLRIAIMVRMPLGARARVLDRRPILYVKYDDEERCIEITGTLGSTPAWAKKFKRNDFDLTPVPKRFEKMFQPKVKYSDALDALEDI